MDQGKFNRGISASPVGFPTFISYVTNNLGAVSFVLDYSIIDLAIVEGYMISMCSYLALCGAMVEAVTALKTVGISHIL